MKQIGNEEGGRPIKNHDGTDIVFSRTQAAIRRCGELLKLIESGTGKNNQYAQVKNDGTVTLQSRTQAAIRRCGELLKQIEPDKGGRPPKTHDGTDMGFSRTQAASQAGLSERQKVTALRVANGEESSPLPP